MSALLASERWKLIGRFGRGLATFLAAVAAFIDSISRLVLAVAAVIAAAAAVGGFAIAHQLGKNEAPKANEAVTLPGCEPGYSPCIPRVRGDLNCNDIPDAKKPIRVTGRDRYRLDGDGDGRACE